MSLISELCTFNRVSVVFSTHLYTDSNQRTLCSQHFCDFYKNIPRSKWIIYKNESNQNNNSLSVGNFGILFVIVCVSIAYTSLFRLSYCN